MSSIYFEERACVRDYLVERMLLGFTVHFCMASRAPIWAYKNVMSQAGTIVAHDYGKSDGYRGENRRECTI